MSLAISVEISMYPLEADYVPPILDFIEGLNTYPNLKVETNGMSTQIFGTYEEVMQALTQTIKPAFSEQHKVAMVMKMLNIDVSNPED